LQRPIGHIQKNIVLLLYQTFANKHLLSSSVFKTGYSKKMNGMFDEKKIV
jgi:hypothetical protein